MTIWDKSIRREKKKTKPKLKRRRKVAKASHKQLKEDSDVKILGSTLNKV